MPLWGRFRPIAVARTRRAVRSSKPVEEKNVLVEPPSHSCGMQGFGRSVHDICEACEFFDLVRQGVPKDIASRAAKLRFLMAPGGSDFITDHEFVKLLREKFKALEREYGKRIP